MKHLIYSRRGNKYFTGITLSVSLKTLRSRYYRARFAAEEMEARSSRGAFGFPQVVRVTWETRTPVSARPPRCS